jgi:hypothetical protein
MTTGERRMLVLDIETAPTTERMVIDRLREDLKPPGNYKKEESIAEWYRTQGHQALMERVSNTALKGMQGDVIAIGWRVIDFVGEGHTLVVSNDEGPRVVVREKRERTQGYLRRVFDDHIGEDASTSTLTWVAGHNLVNFDLPFLWQQFVRHSIPWPKFALPALPSAFDARVFDTMLQLVGARNTISLKDAAYACGIDWDEASCESADVPSLYLADDVDSVRRHLANDVRVTGDLAIRLMMVRG